MSPYLRVRATARKMTETIADMRRPFFARRITWRNRKSLEKGTRSIRTSTMAWFVRVPILCEITDETNARQRLRIMIVFFFFFARFTLAPLRVLSRTDSPHDEWWRRQLTAYPYIVSVEQHAICTGDKAIFCARLRKLFWSTPVSYASTTQWWLIAESEKFIRINELGMNYVGCRHWWISCQRQSRHFGMKVAHLEKLHNPRLFSIYHLSRFCSFRLAFLRRCVAMTVFWQIKLSLMNEIQKFT